MIRALTLLLLTNLSIVSILPSVMSYAKVSKNGQEEMKTTNDQIAWITSNGTQSESRSIKNIAITMSPIYISSKIPALHNGEVTSYSSEGRYSTLDHEMVAKLNAKKQIQDRFHPAPLSSFKHKEPYNNMQDNLKPDVLASNPPASNNFDFSGPTFSDSYEYKSPEYPTSKPILMSSDYLADKPISKPLSMDDYTNSEINEKPQDSYIVSHDPEYPDFSDMTYNGGSVSKPIKHSAHMDHPSYNNDDNESYGPHHDLHHEVIYDHIPEYHGHTEQPEMNDQRLDKRPYSYYFIGKKLWYVPLYFSIYFVIYIAALVLKSIARHKITFPAHLSEAVGHSRSNGDSGWWDYANNILESIENFAEKYGKVS